MFATLVAIPDVFVEMSLVFVLILLELVEIPVALVVMFATLVAIPDVFVEMSLVFVGISLVFVSINPFNNLPWFADNALVVLFDANWSSMFITIALSTKFFKFFPCSADKGTPVPPVVRSFTIEEVAILVINLFSFSLIWRSNLVSASFSDGTAFI